MSSEIGVAEVKRRFSEFLTRVEIQGERVLIRRRGRTVAALVPVGEMPAVDEPQGKGARGILAAAGAFEDEEEWEAFLKATRRARSNARDRKIEKMP